ncbi:MAG TPA: hypothetical protein VIU12_28820 [Chryseolinea sp.]
MNKQLFHMLAIISIAMACSNQQNTQIDLEELTFNENIDKLTKGMKTFEEDVRIGTTLPSVGLYDSNRFRFGPVNGRPDNDVYFLRNKNNRNKIEGLVVIIDQTDQNLEIYHYFTSKFGNPKVWYPLPSFDRDGMQSGVTAYLWHIDKNRFALLSCIYGYDSAIKTIFSHLYVIDRQAKDIYNQPLIERLTMNFKP